MPMKKSVNPELIILARESQGVTQLELANRVGINQANISRIENGFIQPSEDIIEKISQSLSYPISFFYENGSTYSPQVHFFRKAKMLATKDFSIINANGIIDRLRIEKLLNAIEIHTEYVTYDLAEYDSIETIANTLRQQWHVPKGPIQNVASLLESKGIIIIQIDFGSRFISDLTTKTEKGIYIIFLNSSMPSDRKRFTLCHALGHVIMHNSTSSSSIEEEADRFASEFLMPTMDIRHQLTDLDISKLADLKRYWKVSMAAILMKASHLNTITSSKKQYLWKRISSLGYRLNEPVEATIVDEEPTILKEAMKLYKDELNYSEDELKELLFLKENDYQKFGIHSSPKLKLILNNKSKN